MSFLQNFITVYLIMLPYDIAYNIRVYMIVIKNTNTNLRPPPPPDRQFAGC